MSDGSTTKQQQRQLRFDDAIAIQQQLCTWPYPYMHAGTCRECVTGKE